MRQGTTPTITIYSPIDLLAFKVIVTLVQDKYELDLPESRLSKTYTSPNTYISFTLTQEETLQFKSSGRVSVQWKAESAGAVIASDTGSIPVTDILNKKIMETS